MHNKTALVVRASRYCTAKWSVGYTCIVKLRKLLFESADSIITSNFYDFALRPLLAWVSFENNKESYYENGIIIAYCFVPTTVHCNNNISDDEIEITLQFF